MCLFFKFVVCILLFIFVLFRVPYIFGVCGFGAILIFLIVPAYISLVLARLGRGLNLFFSSFVPEGSPFFIAPLVCLAELIRYLVRPVVLLIRPFLKISIGFFGASALGFMCLSSRFVYVFMFFLFLYEVFVALVHWFIVCNIFSFSAEH